MDTFPDEMKLLLARVIQAVANDRGCQPDDLSHALAAELRDFGLRCRRFGDNEGFERAHCEPTVRTTLPGFPVLRR